MIATNSDERRRVTFPADLPPRSPIVIDTLVPGREWIVRVPTAPRRAVYSRGRVVRDKNGIQVWSGDVGEEPADAVARHRAEDDRARE
ncbi:hypothetical protein L6Q96_14070 [Candidatus Binatia bacterium]|nr:hypothetical protein [Candidatus Binatia bacterium]